LTSFVTHNGLPLLFVAVAAESFGFPLPGETALIAFAILASHGRYSIVAVIAVAATAAIVGDNLGYWLIGRRGGRALMARYAWIERRAERVIPRAQTVIARYGGRAVFFGRFVSVLRETIAWVAGLAGMPWRKFLFWNALGGIAWSTAIGSLAYFGGKALADAFSRYGLYAGAAVVAAAVLFFAAQRVIHRAAG
jgi:membrane protein DedA with SNARE-associated domain